MAFCGKYCGYEDRAGLQPAKNKLQEFQELNESYLTTTMIQLKLHSMLRPAMEVVNSMIIALLIWFGYNRIVGNFGGSAVLELVSFMPLPIM